MASHRRIVGIRFQSLHRNALAAALLSLLGHLALLAPLAAAQFPPVPVLHPGPPCAMGIAGTIDVLTELDGDGVLDLVVAGDKSLCVLTGNGFGGFGPPVEHPIDPNYVAGKLLTGDLNLDGVLDIVALAGGPQTASYVLLGDGTGGVGAPLAFFPGGVGPHHGVLGDFDSDGILDLAVALPGKVLLLLGNGTGGFTPQAPFLTPANPLAIVAGDVNADGLLDLVMSEKPHLSNSVIRTFRGNGAGAFTQIGSFQESYTVSSLILAPLKGGDAFPGLVMFVDVAVDDVDFEVRAGNGAGGWALKSIFIGQSFVVGLAVADVNGDANADLLVSMAEYFPAVVFQIAYYLGSGTGAPPWYEGFVGVPEPHGALLTADLAGDGRIDLVSMTQNNNNQFVTVLHNRTPLPAGLTPFGAGSHGCLGPHGIAATVAPRVGTSEFVVTVTNGPPNGMGLLLIGDVPSSGRDPFGFEILMNVDLLGSSFLDSAAITTDPIGYGVASWPIPAHPALANTKLYATGVFDWGSACALASPVGFSSSKGLEIVIAP